MNDVEVGSQGSMTPRQERIQAWRERNELSARRRRVLAAVAMVALAGYIGYSVAGLDSSARARAASASSLGSVGK